MSNSFLPWASPPAPLELAPFRRFHCTATIDNRVYVFGGETKMKSTLDAPDKEAIKRMLADLIVYDTATDEWSVVCDAAATGPARRKGAVLVAYKDTSLFLFGGAGPGVTLNDLWEYSLKERRWIDRSRQIVQSLLELLPQQCNETRAQLKNEDNYRLTETISCERPDLYPMPRAYHTAGIYGNKIFVYGGHGVDVCFSTLWTFDLKEYIWQPIPLQAAKEDTAPVDPGCRFGLSSCVFGTNMYLFGGQQNAKLVNSNLWSLDLENLTWHQPPVIGVPPTPRTYGASCLVGHRWLIHGGSTADHVFSDSHEINLKTHRWSPAPNLHTEVPLEGHQAISTRAPWGGASVLLLGGATSGPLAPEGPLLRCDFLLPPESIGDRPLADKLNDFVIRPAAAADLIWNDYRARARTEQQMQVRQKAEKELSEALDNLRLRYDEMCERYEILLQERSLHARAPPPVPPAELTKLKDLQSKVEDLQSQLTRYAAKKSHAKEETSIAESRYEESVRREQVIIEHITTSTRQLRATRQRIRDELEYPLTRLTEDVTNDEHLFDLAETTLAAAEQVSEDVAAVIASLKSVAATEAASPLSSSRVSRPKSNARSSSVHNSTKRRPARPSVSPSRAVVRSKSESADSAPRAAVRNKSVIKRPCLAEVKSSATPVHRHLEQFDKVTPTATASATVRQKGSPQRKGTITSNGKKGRAQVEEPTPLSSRTEARRARAHEALQKSESLFEAAAIGQHMSSPVQQNVPVGVRGVDRGVSVNRATRANGAGEFAAQESGESRTISRPNVENMMVSPAGIDRSTQCGSGVLKLKASHSAENEKASARSTAGISKGIGADT